MPACRFHRLAPLVAITAALVAGSLGAAPGGGAAQAAAPSRPHAAAAAQPLQVLVLGDSYSAGNGATDDQGNPVTYGPTDCYRSRVNWGEKYAAALRAAGQPVDLSNHACSGGVTADFTSPRVMDTTNHTEATPAGVTTPAQADVSLAQTDPCNTHQFPDEEFWTYQATAVVGPLTSYSCTRNLKPQADFVTPDTDLVLFTMGGNDVGFSTIVTDCFVPVLKSASACQTAVDSARALLPQIQQRILAGVAALRAHGLSDNAKIVQLGYPWLQLDNNYMVGSYDAGNQVRSLVTDGDNAIAAVAPLANVGHPGQMTFVTGVPQAFSGHEPDATTLTGNPDRWLNQVGDGTNTSLWYHPNRFGQTAYAALLTAQGTFGANPTSGMPVTAKLKARIVHRAADAAHGRRVAHLRIKVRLSDRSAPHGKLTVRGLPGHHGKLVTKKVRKKNHGVVRVTVHLPGAKLKRLRITYKDVSGVKAHRTVRLAAGRK